MSSAKSIFLSAFVVSLLAFAAPSFAMSEGCGGDCASCHTITVQEANGLLKSVGTVTAVKPAAVRGLFEVTLQREGRTATAYIDYGKKHLIGGQIFEIATGKAVGAAAPAKQIEKIDPAKLTSDNTLLLGNPKGKKKLFVFTDPECPFCSKMHGELKKLVALEPDLAIYIKLFPLKMHPHAYDKARVILGERSLKLLEKSYEGKPLPAPGAHDAKKGVDETMRFAEGIGINATPTLILPDGRVMPGFREAKDVQQLLR
jgi:thiol:disulfide interchange protein DsbC